LITHRRVAEHDREDQRVPQADWCFNRDQARRRAADAPCPRISPSSPTIALSRPEYASRPRSGPNRIAVCRGASNTGKPVHAEQRGHAEERDVEGQRGAASSSRGGLPRRPATRRCAPGAKTGIGQKRAPAPAAPQETRKLVVFRRARAAAAPCQLHQRSGSRRWAKTGCGDDPEPAAWARSNSRRLAPHVIPAGNETEAAVALLMHPIRRSPRALPKVLSAVWPITMQAGRPFSGSGPPGCAAIPRDRPA